MKKQFNCWNWFHSLFFKNYENEINNEKKTIKHTQKNYTKKLRHEKIKPTSEENWFKK